MPSSRKKLGEPEGGAVAPSRSEGSRLASLVPSRKHCAVAVLPDSIAVRSKAHAAGPTNAPP